MNKNDTAQWPLLLHINALADGEGWCLMVCDDDGMIVIDTDHDAEVPQPDAWSYVEARAAAGSLLHTVAKGMHGLIIAGYDSGENEEE